MLPVHLHCVVVTPEQTLLEAEVEFAVLPLYDGEIGIAPGHSPMIGRLGFGEMRLTCDGQVARYYVDGGFVQVLPHEISVLTDRAAPASSLSEEVAVELLDSARSRPANSPALLDIRQRETDRARAQLQVIRRQREAD